MWKTHFAFHVLVWFGFRRMYYSWECRNGEFYYLNIVSTPEPAQAQCWKQFPICLLSGILLPKLVSEKEPDDVSGLFHTEEALNKCWALFLLLIWLISWAGGEGRCKIILCGPHWKFGGYKISLACLSSWPNTEITIGFQIGPWFKIGCGGNWS